MSKKKEIVKNNVVLQGLDVVYMDVNEIKPNAYNPNRQSEHEFELLCRSIEEDGFCVEQSTPILCVDLIWRAAGELKVGQKIIAFDEDKVIGENLKHMRKYRSAEVISNKLFEDELFLVTTENGDMVKCNAEHLWLVYRDEGEAEGRIYGDWCKTSDLRVGDEVYKILDVWEVDRSYEAGWFAGFLDGEGCVSFERTHNGSPVPVIRLSASQKPGDIAEKMKGEFNTRCSVVEHTIKVHSNHPNWQDNVRVRISNLADIMKLLGSVRPQRLLTNSENFWEGRSFNGKGGCKVKVSSITSFGKGISVIPID